MYQKPREQRQRPLAVVQQEPTSVLHLEREHQRWQIFFYDFVWSFRHFNILGLLQLPPNHQFSNKKAQELVKDRGPLLVPFGMSSCQCSEKRIEQVVIVNNMMIMALSLSLVFEFQTLKTIMI